jgi:hypothetical protein
MLSDDQPDLSFLSAEQADTDRLIRQLLGTAVADRFVDFCRLAHGSLPLIVSRPLAGHALRELDSLIRRVLATPLDAKAPDSPEEEQRRAKARVQLKALGFDERALQLAEKDLKPAYSHRGEIQRIVTRLGLPPDGDVAMLWIKLNGAYGRVHEHSFHQSLKVNESFQADFVRPFETVIRALMVQLEGRYATLMRRAKEIAVMLPAQGIGLFVKEIPGAAQLQGYFYESLQSPAWLPHLAREGLLAEPLPDPYGASGRGLWTWPVGRYLGRMASSGDASTRAQVAEAMRALASSTHPDVHRLGMDAIEVLPAAEAAPLVNVLESWIQPGTDLFSAAPHKIIAKLAAAGDIASAMRVVRAVFGLFERDGDTGAHFDATMYQHYLDGTVKVLSEAGPMEALPGLCTLLMESSRIDRRLSQLPEADYSYYTVRSFEPGPTDSHDFLGALVIAVARVAAAAVRARLDSLKEVLHQLEPYPAKLFTRMRLYLLSLAPASAPDLAAQCLTNLELVNSDWCREEYAALARVWFAYLAPSDQERVLGYIDALPEAHLSAFYTWFERQEKRKADPLDVRRYREISIRDVVWLWRSALPPARQAAIEKTVAEFGDPDAWHEHFFRNEVSPLSRAAMLEQAPAETATFLASWVPDASQPNQTAGPLASELREAVAAKSGPFSAAAERFAPLRPVFIRHFLDGLRQATQHNAQIDWAACLALVRNVLRRSENATADPIPGDDPDWSWTLKAAVDWMASGLRRGAEGIAFEHHTIVRALVLSLAERIDRLPAPKEEELRSGPHPYFSAEQTPLGAVIQLAILFLYWASKNADSAIGKAPREALAHDHEIRHVLERALARNGTAGRTGRAILGRYLAWLSHFGETWVRNNLPALFPREDEALRMAAWVAHIQSDQSPVPALASPLHDLYAEHIAVVGRDDEAFGGNDSRNRLMDYLVILFLWEKLSEDLLQAMWKQVPPALLRHAMWFAGRHMVADNDLRERAKTYWDRRVALAALANDKELFKKELGVIGTWFLWNIDSDWLIEQLLRLINIGIAPNEGIGVIDKLATRLPSKTDEIVEIVRGLVRHPDVQPWIFGTQEQALRDILTTGRASSSPLTVAGVKEIISVLSSRGNPSFLDLDDGL